MKYRNYFLALLSIALGAHDAAAAVSAATPAAFLLFAAGKPPGAAVAKAGGAGTAPHGTASVPTGDWLLDRVDAAMASETKVIVARMVIHGRRDTRTLKIKSWVRGTDRSFTEFLAPARDAGTKMLRLGGELWTYSPAADRTIRISGHMFRQSVMGSDLSYEDLMENKKLRAAYTATVMSPAAGLPDTVLGRRCWIVRLDAHVPEVAYGRREIWVDRDRFVVMRENRFAKSGVLLKTTEVKAVAMIAGRWVPVAIVYRDALQSGAGTELIVDSMEFNPAIPDHLFT